MCSSYDEKKTYSFIKKQDMSTNNDRFFPHGGWDARVTRQCRDLIYNNQKGGGQLAESACSFWAEYFRNIKSQDVSLNELKKASVEAVHNYHTRHPEGIPPWHQCRFSQARNMYWALKTLTEPSWMKKLDDISTP
jgi:hypothetical protein